MLPGALDKEANDGIVHIAPELPVSAGSLILSQLPVNLPLEAASVTLTLKPATAGVPANLFEFTLVKSGKGEYKFATVLIAIGPDVAPGRIEMVGSVVAKNRTGNKVFEIPLEVAIDVESAQPTKSDLDLWFFSAFAHRFIAATVMTGEKKIEWWAELLGGTNPEFEKQNREPNSIKHDLVAYCYGEFLRQIANSGANAAESGVTVDSAEGGLARAVALYDSALIEAVVAHLTELESIELKRAQYIAARLGEPFPSSVEPGYWWKGGHGEDFETDVRPNYKLPPRYRQ